MANPTVGFGLRPTRRLDAAAMSFQLTETRIPWNDSSTIGQGDLAQDLLDGTIAAYTAGDANVAGVFWGCSFFYPAIGRTVWQPMWNAPTLTSAIVVKAWIIQDPHLVFEIRCSGQGAIANNGANFEVTVGTVNALTGQSTTTLLVSSVATTATLPLKQIGLSQRITGAENDNTLTNNIVEVKLNTLTTRYPAAGITT